MVIHGDEACSDAALDSGELEPARRQRQTFCDCILWLLGQKTTAQAIHDTRVSLMKLIAKRSSKIAELEMKYNEATQRLKACRKDKSSPAALRAWKDRKDILARLSILQKQIDGFQERLEAVDAMQDSKESTEAIKQMSKNMKYLKIPKRLKDVRAANQILSYAATDMQELQEVLQPISGDAIDVNASEDMLQSELEQELKEYFAQLSDDEDAVPRHKKNEKEQHNIVDVRASGQPEDQEARALLAV